MRRVTYVFDEDASAASADAITLRKYAVVFYMVPLADIAPFPDFLVVVYLASEDATGDFVVIVIANAAIVAAVVVIVEPTSIQDKNVFPFSDPASKLPNRFLFNIYTYPIKNSSPFAEFDLLSQAR